MRDGATRGTVLVTGSMRRLGAVIAARLRADGWRVLTHSGHDAQADIRVDFSDPFAADVLFSEALRRDPALDAIVCNAGVFAGSAAAIDRINRQIPEGLCSHFAKHLTRRGGYGAFVYVTDADIPAREGPDDTPYVKSKRALAAATVRDARRFAPQLRVNAVAPGAVLPPEGFHLRAPVRLLSASPTAEDVAQAVSFLLAAESVTGVTLPVDGGAHLKWKDGSAVSPDR